MLTIIMEHRTLSAIFISLLSLSIICQIVIGVIYQRLIRETDNMSATGNRLLKQFKLKFENCYKLNGGVANIPVFVDRFIGRISVFHITFNGLQHLSGQLMLLAVAASGVGACREIISGETVGKILPYYIVSFLGLYVWFAISGLVDIQGKKERLKINLVDYLENHMVNKLKQSQIDWAQLTGGESEAEKETAAKETSPSEALREKIGLSAVRSRKKAAADPEPLKTPMAASEEEGTKESAVTVKNTDRDKETEETVFGRPEEEELEELLREFFA